MRNLANLGEEVTAATLVLGKWQQRDLLRDGGPPMSKEAEQKFRQSRQNLHGASEWFTLQFLPDSTFRETALSLETLKDTFRVRGNYLVDPSGNGLYIRYAGTEAVGQLGLTVNNDSLEIRNTQPDGTQIIRVYTRVKN
jgi:hypothetical protein